ncbi:MAG: AI-2E family transporter [Mogibacterium sp.]|nr:AI-2E family transporter [Mogibacterium sp.]
MRERWRDKKWYPYTVAACIAVTLYVVLNKLSPITNGILTFIGYFSTILIACVLAYIMNPLALLFQRRVFNKVPQAKFRWNLSVGATVISIILILSVLLRTLVPQLIDSFVMLLGNMDGYLASLQDLTEKWGLSDTLRIEHFIASSGDVVSRIQAYFVENANSIVNASAEAGKSVVSWVIALILSIYFLSAKDSLKRGVLRLMHALVPGNRIDSVLAFLGKWDNILVRYIVFSILDAVIIGVINFIFMACMGMQYAGLISVVVAVTNLVPTFGPIVGGAIGGFILLLVKPLHALIFIIFTFILQFIDPYFIKPRLFGNSLGVSGLLILASVIVFGNMFGFVGILLAIPIAAIIDYVYDEALLPALERRNREAKE